MSDKNRRGGYLNLQINGTSYDAIGDFIINYGARLKKGAKGPDKVHGYTDETQIPFISGAIRDGSALDIKNELLNATDATLTLLLANGKTGLLEEAWFALEGDVSTEEGSIAIKFEGMSAEEIPG